jgi:DNA excision repair protein ERCC-2
LKTIRLAVKDFATPLYPKGDLRRDGSMIATPEVGVAIHNQIQDRLADEPGYQRECALKLSLTKRGFKFVISGRADGLFVTSEKIIIEEIKTTFSLSQLVDQVLGDEEHPYRLQATTYAYLYFVKFGVVPTVRLRLVCLRSEREDLVEIPFDAKSYYKWFKQKIALLARDCRMVLQNQRRRQKLAVKLAFPFTSLRAGQRELIEKAQETFEEGGQLMVQAPTGIGKTMGFIYPALKNGLSRGAPLIYLTPKNSQFKVVGDAAALFHRSGAFVRVLFLTSKTKLCLKTEPSCDPQHCEYAAGYYDKLREKKVLQKLMKQAILDRDLFATLGSELTVCPYALSKELIAFADLVVGDYNYVFSPDAAIKQLVEPLHPFAKSKHNLLIDEAHNLYQRAMEYYSPGLEVEYLNLLSTREVAVKSMEKEFLQLLKKALRLIKSYRPMKLASSQIQIELDPFMRFQYTLTQFLQLYQPRAAALAMDDPVVDLCHYWSNFVTVLAGAGDESLATYRIDQGEEAIKLLCCNPAKYLEQILNSFHAVIAFSATLKPYEFYRKLSGFDEECPFEEFSTSFPAENRKVIIIPQVSTAFRDREQNYAKIADAILKISRTFEGHYVVFVPSFQFLTMLAEILVKSEFSVYQQEPRMSRDDLEQIASHWFEEGGSSLTLAVQGGGLAEGFDADTQYLRGAFVIGPALPSFEFERELLRSYYEKEFKEGFSYAYVYPAMAKSIQAAGRVIRSEKKRGLIVMMDRRFLQDQYAGAMPSYWFQNHVSELASTGILQVVKEFWQKSLS